MANQKSKTLRILVADDNETCLFLLGQMLHALGCIYDSAKDGEEAFEKVLKKQYDLILMDIDMPRLNGVAATKKIRRIYQNPTHPAIIAVTGNTMADNRLACEAAGMQDFLEKPIDERKLEQIIRKWAMTLAA